MAKQIEKKIAIENFAQPGKVYLVDATRYGAMKRAFLKVLPKRAPGLTREEVIAAVTEEVPEKLFPDGHGVTWWSKAVQLDLEAKGVILREKTRPLRWRKA